MADIKNFGIVGVGTSVQYGKGGGSLKWDTDGFVSTTDGTTLAHFDAANVNFTGLSGTGAVSVTNILDEDNMASDSDTALATQQSIKAYVDSQVGATTLSGTGDSGAFSVDLDSETFGVFGGTNLTSTGSGSNVTVALDADISLTSVTATGAIEGGSLTDGTATLTSGALTGATNITASGAVQFGSLTDGSITINGFIDDDTMATASADTLATSESIKAYVDAVATAADLDIAGDTGTGTVDLDSQVFTIAGGIALSSSTSGQTTTVRLDNTAVTAGVYGDATNIPQFTVDQQGRITAASNVAIQTSWTLAGDSGSETVDGGDTATFAGGTNITTTASATDTLTIDLDDDVTLAGNLTAVNGTFSGSVQFGSGSGGSLSGLASIEADNVSATGNLIVGGYAITDILDEDDMVSDSDTAVPTQQSVKAYVDAVATAADLDFQGDLGTGAVDLDSQALDIAGGTGIETAAASQTLTVTLSDTAVTAGNYGSATQIPTFTVDAQGRLTAASNVALVTAFTLAGDSGTDQTISGGDTMTIAGGTNINTVGTNTDTLTVNLDAEIALTNVTATGYIQGGFLTDGVATLSSGSLTGAVNGTFSGTVDAGTVEFDNLSGTGAVTVTDIIDDDSMASASATTLATSESVKAYVDATAGAADLDFQGDSGSGAVDLDSQTLDIAGGLNLTTTASGQTLTVAMDTTLTGMTAATFSGQVQAGTLTDGTLSITAGAITGATNITATGTVQGGTLTDGTASINAGAITGATDITATGTIQGNTLRDSILTINGGAISGATTGSFSGTVSAGNLDASGGLVTFNQLSDGTLTMDAILDEDNMASDSATALPTQQSVKAYVDSQISLQGAAMNIQGDTGTGSIVFATETLDIAGTANEIETSFDNGTNTMTIGLPDDVTMGNVTVGGTLFSNDITANTVEIDGDMTVIGDTVMQGNLTVQGNTTIVNSNTITTGDNVITLNADLPAGQAPSQDMGILMNRGSSANVEILWLETVDYFVFRDENGDLQEVRASEFNATQFTGGNATISGDVSFGTLTDSGESITIDKFVDEADGIVNNDNDTSIPTTAAVIDYVTNNGGDGNLIRNGSVGTGATTVTIGTVPNVTGRTYYVEKVVIKVTVAFSGNSVDHIILNENGGLGTQIVAEADADIATGTYIVESDGATELTKNQSILLGFRDSGNNLVAPTAGACSVAVYYAWD